MSRYIKFDDAVKVMACEMYAEAQSQGYDVDGIEDFMPEAKAWLNDAPSIDIVFCKECKHRKKNGFYVQNLTDLNDTQQKRIETATRKKEKIIEEASIRKLAEQMKEDEKNAEQNEL